MATEKTYINRIKNKENILKLYSLFIALSIYILGNFAFFNIFNIKLEMTILIYVVLLIMSLYIVLKNKMKFHMLTVFILYLLLSSLLIEPFDIKYFSKLLLVFLAVSSILLINNQYLDLIIKCIIVVTLIFSIVGIFLFIFYILNQDLLIGLERVFKSYERFIDLSNLPIYQKFGFVIESPEKNLFGLEYIRSRSYCSEPSATVPLFFAVGILALLYKGVWKNIAFVILVFSIILIYSGSAILSLIMSLIIYVGFFIRASANIKALIIVCSAVGILVLIYLIDISLFQYITPESKVTSAPSRLLPIKEAIGNFIYNPFFNKEGFSGSFIGMLFVLSGSIPILGLLLVLYIFYNIFKFLMEIYDSNKLFVILMSGLMMQILVFSSGGWMTYSGLIILSLIYIKLENIYRMKIIEYNRG